MPVALEAGAARVAIIVAALGYNRLPAKCLSSALRRLLSLLAIRFSDTDNDDYRCS